MGLDYGREGSTGKRIRKQKSNFSGQNWQGGTSNYGTWCYHLQFMDWSHAELEKESNLEQYWGVIFERGLLLSISLI